MNTPNPEIQIPAPGRRHARYSDGLKGQVAAACLEPGVSKAVIALANGLKANALRRWVVESSQGCNSQLATIAKPQLTALAHPDFIPVKFALPPPAQATDIRIELPHARGGVLLNDSCTLNTNQSS